MAKKKRKTKAPDDLRIDIDLDHAAREAQRIAGWLDALRDRHNLAPYEYTRHIRIVPAGPTYSHPILTLGTRFAETEDHLLATYLHEQMHWYLWRFGGPDYDPIAPFFDELVRRYPKAPTRLPDGARNYEQTYLHIVVCFLELKAVSEFIGFERSAALAETHFGYRWIYRTVVKDWDALETLFTRHRLLPIVPAERLDREAARLRSEPKRAAAVTSGKPVRKAVAAEAAAPPPAAAKAKSAGKKRTINRAVPRKMQSADRARRSRRSRRRPQGRGGRSRG
jgi:hypothetical protein